MVDTRPLSLIPNRRQSYRPTCAIDCAVLFSNIIRSTWTGWSAGLPYYHRHGAHPSLRPPIVPPVAAPIAPRLAVFMGAAPISGARPAARRSPARDATRRDSDGVTDSVWGGAGRARSPLAAGRAGGAPASAAGDTVLGLLSCGIAAGGLTESELGEGWMWLFSSQATKSCWY